MFSFKIEKQAFEKSASLESNYDVVVIGAGPGGLNASLYAKRKGLNVILITKTIGGQLTSTNLIENYLGVNSISGEDLTSSFSDHVKDFEVPLILDLNVDNIIKKDNYFYLTLEDGQRTKTKTVIVATGGSPRKLNIPGEKDLIGKGVSYCGICDGPFYKNKDVAVIGGGNSAIEAAIDLAKIAKSITVIELQKSFMADKILIDRLNSFDNVKLILHGQTKKFISKDGILSELIYEDLNTNEDIKLSVDGVFIEIGVIPNNNVIKDLVDLNKLGEVIVDINQQTSLEGMYAVGDLTNFPYKQIVIAASQGAVAALSANNFINKKEN